VGLKQYSPSHQTKTMTPTRMHAQGMVTTATVLPDAATAKARAATSANTKCLSIPGHVPVKAFYSVRKNTAYTDPTSLAHK
jgi:hypothetical protein